MKKTVLSIALFSLIAVSTSFASADNSKMISVSKISIDPTKDTNGANGTGATTIGGKKHDFQLVKNEVLNTANHSNFSNINQSIGATKKID